ncbi:nitric oxide synthase-interacting protein [Babesia microti strain RI]|uniref:Nitric oxide synthase-interacting protein n=1 Tax=Babesia microti (strain RI) TaxID=1133968 RepID=I7J9F8_BABMR|nr:nitric oxide synthase-interacting protein [Babesia microti strain RI]CCF75858.2 nitric oxide synthase-interacting protein [Babesia microti strain RI]|eukprot:XP_021337205.1 nitric oxide synthase-interacting protein [Babesia microti strain RI]
MTRHSKNSTAAPIFTYHEKKKIKDWYTLKERLGADSMRKFHDCWLCLHQASMPVTTPRGHIFCKECILENFTKQKKEIKLKLSQWEHKTKKLVTEKSQKKLIDEEKMKLEFIRKEIAPNLESAAATDGGKINNFWVPMAAPDYQDKHIGPKPSTNLVCPISGKPIKLKHLIDIKPECGDEGWVCSFTKKPISHQQALLVIPTGQIILATSAKTILAPNSGFCDRQLSKKDLLKLIPGGTGFSAHNKVEAKLERLVMPH